ncbi:hypothetical protein V8B97DRAFT_1987272 [Scleroderma yunnanense]
MPGKHVRFAEENAFYSPPPSTPSPSLSDSSLPSSLGPTTPPQGVYPHLPYTGGPVTIHPLLAYHPLVAPVIYNMSYPLSHSLTPNVHASPSCSSAGSFDSALNQPATSPPLPTLTLIHPHLPWRPHIRPSNPASCLYVTVRDVLEALYAFLHYPVTMAEYKMLPSQVDRDEVSYAFHARCEREQERKTVEWMKSRGVRRVDFLRGRNQFMGLSSTKFGPDMWILNVA